MSRGAGLLRRLLHTKYAEAPTEPAGETKSFCPCQSRRGLCIVRDDFFFLKSHRLTHAVAPPLPKKSLTFGDPINLRLNRAVLSRFSFAV